MYEELKARLKATEYDDLDACKAADAIDQLERQLAERDAELKKYRDAPVVASIFKSIDEDGSECNEVCFSSAIYRYNMISEDDVIHNLIVKPGEQR